MFHGIDLRRESESTVVVLVWTQFWKSDMKIVKGSGLNNLTCYNNHETNENYKVLNKINYFFTTDRSVRKSANAILFHGIDLKRADLPENHPTDQFWIFWLNESPIYTNLKYQEKVHEVFNWTMTYRRDSDIYDPNSEVISVSDVETSRRQRAIISEKSLNHKTNLIAWVIADCISQSKWMDLANKLKKFIPIDIYGRCGSKTCPRPKGSGSHYAEWSSGTCFPEIAKTYKFYLSFENSLCVDYVTEKLYNPLSYSDSYILPVVYGYANYSFIAPPHSFIDANSFASVKALADYLHFLDKNATEYLKYFDWKTKYSFRRENMGWCRLIQKLGKIQRNGVSNSDRKSYPDVFKWWNNSPGNSKNPACVTPEQFSPHFYS